MKMRSATIIIWLGIAALIPAAASAATIIGAAQQAGDFTALLKAGKAAGLDKALEGKGPFTLFAPNDAAFSKVPKAKLDTLMKPANLEMLKTTLGSHLLTGVLSMQAIEAGLGDNDAVVATTVNNMPLVFKREGDAMTVNGAKMKPPMRVDNGLIYVIDTVLVPPMPLQPIY